MTLCYGAPGRETNASKRGLFPLHSQCDGAARTQAPGRQCFPSQARSSSRTWDGLGEVLHRGLEVNEHCAVSWISSEVNGGPSEAPKTGDVGGSLQGGRETAVSDPTGQG